MDSSDVPFCDLLMVHKSRPPHTSYAQYYPHTLWVAKCSFLCFSWFRLSSLLNSSLAPEDKERLLNFVKSEIHAEPFRVAAKAER